jgi:G protein beta subunit-like protein
MQHCCCCCCCCFNAAALFDTAAVPNTAAAAAAGEAIRTYSGHHKAITCCALNDSAIDGRDADS